MTVRKRSRLVWLGLVTFGIAGASALFSSASAEEVVDDVDVTLTSVSDAGGGFDLRQTCTSVRTQINDWFGEPQPSDALRLKVPGFDLAPVTMADAKVAMSCDTSASYLRFEGLFTVGTTPIDTAIDISWTDSSDAIPDVTIDLDSSPNVADPIFSVADTVAWTADLVGADAADFDTGPIGGADFELQKLKIHFRWAEGQPVELDATAESRLLQGDTAEVSDDLAIGFLISITVPDGAEPTLLAGIHLANAEPGAATFNLGGLLRGAPGELVTSIELPEMYLATVQPPGQTVSVSELRPLAKAFFDDHGPDVEGLPGETVGEPFEFDSNVTLASEINLDHFGDGLRDAFGYPDGATAIAVGQIGLTFEDINSATPAVDFTGVDIDILLPTFDGDDAALLPDWFTLADTKANIAWDDEINALLVEADAVATIEVPDPSQPVDHDVDLTFHVAAQLMVLEEGGGTTLTFALRGETLEQATPVWPNPYYQDWLNLNSLGAELVVIDPADAPAELDAALTSTFDIGGKDFAFRAAFETGVDGTEVTLNLQLHDLISATDVLSVFGVNDVPAAFDGLSIGPNPDEDPDGAGPLTPTPVSITARIAFPGADATEDETDAYFAVNAPATVDLMGNGGGLRMGFLFSIRTGATASDPPILTVGGRISQTELYTALGGILPADLIAALPDSFNFDLPDLGLLFASAPIEARSEELLRDAPEEYEFFRHLLGCPGVTPPPGCTFTVELGSGVHFLSGITLPEDEETGRPMLADVFDTLGMNGDSPPPLLLQISLDFPEGGAPSIAFRMILPVTFASPPDWFDSAKLGITFAVDESGLKLTLGGTLGVRMADETRTTEDECTDDPEPKPWLARAGTNPPVYACYDILEFGIATELKLGTEGVGITIRGTLDSPGWHPFGFDWLRVDGGAIELGFVLDASGNPQFSLGLRASGALFGKDFVGAVMFGVRIVPAAPSPIPVPDFKGVRLSSQAGVELADVVKMYEFVDERAALLGIPELDLPTLNVDLDALPNISLRNLDFMLGLVSNESLCIEPGFRIAGELYLNAEPLTDAPAAGEGGCVPPPTPPEQCLNLVEDPCFAAVQVEATLGGIIVAGGLGAFDIGPLHWDQALLDFRLTPTVQQLRVYGGATIDAVGSGQIDLTIASDGMAFLGDIRLFGPSSFRALVEGEFGVGLGSGVKLEEIVDVDFRVHALLQGDFASMMQGAVGPPLQLARDTAIAVLAIYDEIKATNGDIMETLRALPGELTSRGVAVPLWLHDPDNLDLLDVLNTVESQVAQFGLELPTLGEILEGLPVDIPGVPGFVVPAEKECRQVFFGVTSLTLGVVRSGDCYTYAPGTWLGGDDGVAGRFVNPKCWAVPGVTQLSFNADGECWIVEPTEILVGGACGALGISPCTVTKFLESFVEPPLVDVMNVLGVPGDDFSDMMETLVDGISAGVPPLRLECADFEINTADGGGIDLRLDSNIFGTDFGFELGWDFAASPTTQAQALVDDFLAILFGTAPPVECEPLGTITIAGGGRGIATSTDAEAPAAVVPAFSITTDTIVVDEGGSVTVTGTFTGPWTDADAVAVTWGDGSATASTVGAVKAGITHTYADDNPTGTTSDPYTITAVAKELTESTPVTVRNVAPSGVTAALAGGGTTALEGTPVTVTGSFTDPGTEASHTVTIDWGDGSAKTVVDVTGGARTYSADHTYVDDNPTGTPSDSATIKVKVADDDAGSATTTTGITVQNVAPSAVTLAPVGVETVQEGNVVTFDVGFVDPGTADTHTVVVVWGDGTTTTAPANAGGTLSLEHLYVDDHPATGTPSDVKDATVTVTDDDTGEATVTTAITVHNVAPSVDFDVTPASVVENDDGVVTVTGELVDPGIEDTHTVTIDWGYAGFDDTVLTLPVGTREFAASRTYGDDGTFDITVSVVDDDTGEGSNTHAAVVTNADPTVVIDDSGSVTVDGGVTFIVRKGSELVLAADIADVGSDDLRLTWDWDSSDRFESGANGTTQSPWFFPSPQTATDSDPSPEVRPHTKRNGATKGWSQPCLYLVTATVEDDDGGDTSDTVWVVVTGTSTRREVTGWWHQQYLDGSRNRNDIDDVPTLSCYLEIVGHMSSVFGDDDVHALSSAAQARAILDPAGASDDVSTFDRQLLAAWLNFANGAAAWSAMVDTNCDKKTDTMFSVLMTEAEALRNDPSSNKAALIAAKNKLDCVNRNR